MKEKKIWKRVLTILLLFAIVATLVPALPALANVTNDTYMQMLPDSYVAGSGKFVLTANSRIFLESEEMPSDDMIHWAQFISQQFGSAGFGFSTSLPVVYGNQYAIEEGDILVSINYAEAGSKAEGYKIIVSDGLLEIIGADSRGLMYGVYTVIKMLRANGSTTLGGCTITDAPEAKERTVMLDCGRKYFTPEWIKNYIREMAYMGYNTFEIHFAEDQGMRLDIWDSNYFTSKNGNDFTPFVGGWAASWLVDKYENYADKDKYLTAKEMVEIIEVAKQYQIEIIPSFDTPMHCQYLRYKWRAYVMGDNEMNLTTPTVNKNFSFNFAGNKYNKSGITNLSTGVLTEYDNDWNVWGYIQVCDDNGNRGYTKTLDVTNAVSRSFMEALLEDYADFFKQYGCTKFNICADEVAFYSQDGWQTYARQILGAKYNNATLKSSGTKYDTFVDYVNEITDLLHNKGYKVRIFSDFVDRKGLGGANYKQTLTFNEDLEIMYWWLPGDNSSVQSVTHFVNSGYTLYNCVQNYTYYVLATNSSGHDGRDPNTTSWTWQYASADRIFNNWNPTVFTHPQDLGTSKAVVVDANKVSGGYFLIWTDYGAYNTENQIWNGVDSTGKYNIIERMWSNSQKMWTYDLNSKISYTNFNTVTKKLGHYPGYTDCTKATVLPAASPIEKVYGGAGLCVYHKTMVNGKEHILDFANVECLAGTAFTYPFYDRYGYEVDHIEGATTVDTLNLSMGCYFIPHDTGADGGLIHGVLENDVVEITIWYRNTPDNTNLETLVQNAEEKGSYTEESWSAYSAALAEAQAVYNAGSGVCQEEIDAATKKLVEAQAGLEAPNTGATELLDFRMGTSNVEKGRYGVLFFNTTTDVSLAEIRILDAEGNQIPIASFGIASTKNENGEALKQWRVRFVAETTGNLTYTLHADSITQDFSFTCS